MAPCSHEEADTRIFLHARQAVDEGSKNIIVKANGTDVLVIAVSVLPTLQEIGLRQLWIAFGQGQNLRWIPVHELVFKLSQYLPTIDDADIRTLEKFVVMMYDRSGTAECVDGARLDMFSRKQRPYEAIPPTRGALIQHVNRAAYQAACIWGQALLRQPEAQSPAYWGWIRKGDLWHILWTELPPIAENCRQLTKCGCKSECCGRCKCFRFGLDCTALCSCRRKN
ncbi:hypothetical protein HOLleu_05134 [Holothuria leucospilota]|uniref:Uncharacterized protein n=1 Tax=Holothuria leucospilota TaxID=206669 RepID=A0A9Q1CKN8_HOLLE|nr:hypothetical protein HOLleu_05134 [Holothuria leucospilota]